jgi:hypothetical protein
MPPLLSNPQRTRDEDCSSPPAQIPACAANAPGLYEDAIVKGVFCWCLAILIAIGCFLTQALLRFFEL